MKSVAILLQTITTAAVIDDTLRVSLFEATSAQFLDKKKRAKLIKDFLTTYGATTTAGTYVCLALGNVSHVATLFSRIVTRLQAEATPMRQSVEHALVLLKAEEEAVSALVIETLRSALAGECSEVSAALALKSSQDLLCTTAKVLTSARLKGAPAAVFETALSELSQVVQANEADLLPLGGSIGVTEQIAASLHIN